MLTEIRANTATLLQPIVNLAPAEIVSLLEVPKNLEHGHLAFPVFPLAKIWRKGPPVIAKELAQKIMELGRAEIARVEPVGGYVNFHFQNSYLQNVLTKVLAAGPRLGYSALGENKTVVIDFSSPNVAKPMSVGHLRATVIGQAICNLARTQGYKVIGLNHLGDWGVQFGKLAWAYQNWGGEYAFQEKPFASLYALYVRFHEEAEKNPDLEKQGALVFKRLEEGDAKIEKLWKMFVEISLKEYQRLWDLLGVKHDLVRGESFYNDRLQPTEALLEKAGLLTESEGAMVVAFQDEEMPPCLIRKSDGASLYATRDLASAMYRFNELKADLNLYVVGVEQSLHFKQVFKVLDMLKVPWADKNHHIAFGLYRFKEGKMSTRKGNVIFLEDILTRAIDLVDKIIQEKNPELPERAKVARQVGVGAVIFNDLVNDRVKDVDFDWERVLDFEGDSGPYVQYCVVRCKSLMRKYGKAVEHNISAVLESPEERELVKILLGYQDTLAAAFKHFKPHLVATYLLEVCRTFNHFYHKHRILGEAPEVESSRMSLVRATEIVLEQGLRVLNIEAPDAM